MFQADPPTDVPLEQRQRHKNSSWTLRPQLWIYLAIWRRTEQACTDISPDLFSRLAGFAVQGLSQPEAMSLYSTALGEFFCHVLLIKQADQQFQQLLWTLLTTCVKHLLLFVMNSLPANILW